MSKKTFLVFILTMTILLLSGCGNNVAQTQSGSVSETVTNIASSQNETSSESSEQYKEKLFEVLEKSLDVSPKVLDCEKILVGEDGEEIFTSFAENKAEVEENPKKNLPIVKIDSYNKLKKITKQLQSTDDTGEQIGKSYLEPSEYYDKVREYTEDFFENNTLFMVRITEGCLGYIQNITGLDIEDGNMSVQISTVILPGSYADEIETSILFFELPNEKVNEIETFNTTHVEESVYCSKNYFDQ